MFDRSKSYSLILTSHALSMAFYSSLVFLLGFFWMLNIDEIFKQSRLEVFSLLKIVNAVFATDIFHATIANIEDEISLSFKKWENLLIIDFADLRLQILLGKEIFVSIFSLTFLELLIRISKLLFIFIFREREFYWRTSEDLLRHPNNLNFQQLYYINILC